MPVACVYCHAGTDIMSAAIMSADIMFLPDVLAWQAGSAFYLYEVITMLKIQCDIASNAGLFIKTKVFTWPKRCFGERLLLNHGFIWLSGRGSHRSRLWTGPGNCWGGQYAA